MMVFQNGVPEKIVGTKGLIKSVSSDISQMLICFSWNFQFTLENLVLKQSEIPWQNLEEPNCKNYSMVLFFFKYVWHKNMYKNIITITKNGFSRVLATVGNSVVNTVFPIWPKAELYNLCFPNI